MVHIKKKKKNVFLFLHTLRIRKWQPTPVFLPGEFHGQRSLAGYSTQVTKSRT